MAQAQLQKAFELMKAGQTREALALTQAVLKQDRDNVSAWWLMTNILADDPERQKKALERVLALDPQHKGALQLQAKLNPSKSTPVAPSPRPQTNPQALSTEEINLDWSKLDKKEAKGKKKKNEDEGEEDAASSNAVKLAGYLMLILIIAVVIFAVIFGLIPTIQSNLRSPADQVVVNFYSNFFAGNYEAARTAVCPESQETFDTMVELQQSVPNLPAIDISGLVAAVAQQTNTTARVDLSGEIVLTIGEAVQTFSIEDFFDVENASDASEQLRLENGAWCIVTIE